MAPSSRQPPQSVPSATELESDDVTELREQLEQTKQEQSDWIAMQVQQSVNRLWRTTQLLLIILGLVLNHFHWVAVLSYVALLLYVHTSKTSALRRQAHVWWTGFTMYCILKITWWNTRDAKVDKKFKEQAWHHAHSVIARFLFEQIAELGGFWTKLGQQLSVNAALPGPYPKHLKQLQDGIPPSPLSEILLTLREEFGDAIFSRISIDEDAPPLGVASVAQVHRGTYLMPGEHRPRDLAFKVQHRGSARRFRQDLQAFSVLSSLGHWWDPECIPDFSAILKTMTEVTLQELDFRLEARNQIRARRAVLNAGVDVIIPEVFQDLVAAKAMAMEYIDGVRIENLSEELPDADPARIIASLVDHYGVQFTVDGCFHADPHPGNLMVDKKTCQLVVLDWGMCITLPPEQVESYARLFYSVAASDVWMLIDALEHIGLHFKEDEVFEPCLFLAALRLALRDSENVDMAKKQFGDAVKTGQSVADKVPQRYKRSPVQLFSGDLLYFGRALEMLYMLAYKLEVSHPVLRTLLNRAYQKLSGCEIVGVGIPRGPEQFLPKGTSLPPARSSLERKLASLLQTFTTMAIFWVRSSACSTMPPRTIWAMTGQLLYWRISLSVCGAGWTGSPSQHTHSSTYSIFQSLAWL